MTDFLAIDDDQIVSDMSHKTCVTNVIQVAGFYEKRVYCWGLMGLELGDIWHQVVWIEREDDIVICDPSCEGERLLKHD